MLTQDDNLKLSMILLYYILYLKVCMQCVCAHDVILAQAELTHTLLSAPIRGKQQKSK